MGDTLTLPSSHPMEREKLSLRLDLINKNAGTNPNRAGIDLYHPASHTYTHHHPLPMNARSG